MQNDKNDTIKLLHLDDNEDYLLIFKSKIKQMGFNLDIEWSFTADDALDKVSNNRYDCILSDHDLRAEQDGLDFLRELKKREINIPFIYLTGQGNEDIAADALRLGVSDYYTKDYGIAYFQRIVNSIYTTVNGYRNSLAKSQAEAEVNRLNTEREQILNDLNEFIFSMFYDEKDEIPFRFTYISPSVYKITGYKQEEYIQNEKLWMSVIHPDDLRTVTSRMKQPFSKKLREKMFRFKHKNGDWIWLTLKMIPDQDGDDSHTIRGIARNVTEVKLIKDAFDESEERFRILTDQSHQPVLITDKTGVLYTNTAFAKVMNFTKEEIEGWDLSTLFNVLHPDDKKEVVSNFFRRIKGDSVQETYSLRAINSEGKTKWVDVYNKLVTFNGKPAVQSVFMDITVTKINEMKISRLDKLFNLSSEINRNIKREKNINKLLESSINLIKSHLGYDELNVYLIDDSSSSSNVIESVDGSNVIKKNLSSFPPCIRKAIKNSETRQLINGSCDFKQCDCAFFQKAPDMLIPISSDGFKLGVFSINFSESLIFTDDARYLKDIAENLAGACQYSAYRSSRFN